MLALGNIADTGEVLDDLKITRDDSVLEPEPEKIRRWGFSEEELEAIGPDRAAELVLERVALLEINR